MIFDWRQEAEEMAARLGFERLRGAVETLSAAYREGRGTESPRLDAETLVAAYLAVRFPATNAVGRAVARAILDRLPGFHPESLLDLGAGCGAASLALIEEWGEIEAVTAVERITSMARIGKQVLPRAVWRNAKFEDLTELPGHDAVLFSYALGETPGDILPNAWAAAERMLIVIEPGTPRGFGVVSETRDWLIAEGASILAPCPGAAACPAKGVDWCHFSARLNRTSLHRRLKGGTLGYEDEKYSYVVGWKGEIPPGPERILRHPLILPGRIEFDLCAAPERRKVLVTKRDKEGFRRARKLEWGDAF